METRKHLLPILGSILILLLVMQSCSPSKKAAVSCTEFPVYKSSRTRYHNGQKTMLTMHLPKIKRNRHAGSEKRISTIIPAPERESAEVAKIGNINKTEFAEELLASSDNKIVPFNGSTSDSEEHYTDAISYLQISKCDTIILLSGSVIYGKVEEIGQTEIKYRKCNYLNGPLISIARSEVSSIRFINGSRENFNAVVPQTYTTSAVPDHNYQRTNEALGVAGFLASIIGLFIASIPLGLIAVIFGGISLKRIRRDPAKYKGRGLAVASIIIGIIDVVAMIIILAAV